MNEPMRLRAGGGPPITVQQQAIEWAPIAEGGRLPFNGTSYRQVRDALFKVFGKFPIRLSKDNIPQIVAMSAVIDEGSAPYQCILDALRKYGDLELRDL